MNASHSPHTSPHAPVLKVLAPEMARRVGMILDNLKALIAARFLRIPFLLPLLMPLWKRLNRIQRRLQRAMELHGVVRKARARQPTRMRDTAIAPLPQLQLPRRFGWLIAALGWEAAGYGSHLEHLLAQPDVAAMLAACPGARRVLRPVAHMLRFRMLEPVEPAPVAQAAARERPANFRQAGADNLAGDGLAAVVASKIEKGA